MSAIPLAARYFGPGAPAPVVHEAYRPGEGWARLPDDGPASADAVRALAAAGATRVALRSGARVADFSVRELLDSAARAAPEPPPPVVCRREACVDLAGGPMRVDHLARDHRPGR